MPFGASRHVVSLIRFSHHDGCRLVHPDTWYQLNVIHHQDGCRLVHPAKWDIGKFRDAFVTDADLYIPSGGSFDISINLHLWRIPFNESRLYHLSHSFGFQISHFNCIITFRIIFSKIYSIYVLISYTHSYTHSRILIHVY